MQIYFTSSCNQSQSFHRFIEDYLKYQDKGEIFLVEEFNACIRFAQFTQFGGFLSSSSSKESNDSLWSRISCDPPTNDLTEHFFNV